MALVWLAVLEVLQLGRVQVEAQVKQLALLVHLAQVPVVVVVPAPEDLTGGQVAPEAPELLLCLRARCLKSRESQLLFGLEQHSFNRFR